MKRALRLLSCAALVFVLVLSAFAQGGELRFCIKSDPKTFNPVAVADDASETVRYLTGGVLVRVNRQTQQLEPELATSWKITNAGKTITFTLRPNQYFSDGTPFTAEDVAFTVKQLTNPNLHSPTGDAFRSGTGDVTSKILSGNKISITFPGAIAGLDRLFDQVAIMSARSPKKERAVLGPFFLADHKPGSYLYFRKNNNYWKKDAQGRKLPLLDAVRLDIQPNREIEVMRFRRGEIDLINSLDSDFYAKLQQGSEAQVRDAGASLDSEQLWFNQVPGAPIADYKKAWFKSQNFRRAVALSINRADLVRIVFGGHAQAAIGPTSPANKFWFNTKLKALPYDTQLALNLLKQDGFQLQGGTLKDAQGRTVEFSIVTNSSSKPRERMATMIQQDLSRIGIKVNVVTLDFPSMIERITAKFNYEAAILGFINTEMDPNSQMTVWLSSGENHAWNPNQKSPATAWEAEMDKLMQAQTQSPDPKKRKAAWDRVQEIVYEQQPMIYLVNKNALSAVSSNLVNAAPVVLRPQTYWNIDRLYLKSDADRSGK
ncbi:MAG TPA: ABC transporter substrate-binding protein [Terriglobales bacterium]|nr:ABC transporter substrate-binding protein [Terriglobales bacterium]